MGNPDDITITVPRAHGTQMLDFLRAEMASPNLHGKQELKGWIETDLIRPLETAARTSPPGGTQAART